MRKMLAAGAALALVTSIAAGQGYGPGMTGGYGGPMMGQGSMMGAYGGQSSLNLSDEQQTKIFAIQEEHRRKNFDAMGKMRAEMFQLRRMYNADNVDAKAVVEQQAKVDGLRRQMLASHLEMRKQIEGVLTPEQRKQMRQFGPWWAGESE